MKTNNRKEVRFRAPPCGLRNKKNESNYGGCKRLLTFTYLPTKININKGKVLFMQLFEYILLG